MISISVCPKGVLEITLTTDVQLIVTVQNGGNQNQNSYPLETLIKKTIKSLLWLEKICKVEGEAVANVLQRLSNKSRGMNINKQCTHTSTKQRKNPVTKWNRTATTPSVQSRRCTFWFLFDQIHGSFSSGMKHSEIEEFFASKNED